MFSFLHQRPHLMALLVFLPGVWAGFFLPLPAALVRSDIPLLCAPLVMLGLAWASLPRRPAFRQVLLGFALAYSGYLLSSLNVYGLTQSALRGHCGDNRLLCGEIAGVPKWQRGHLRFRLRVESVGGQPAPGACFVYLKADDDATLELLPGDRLALIASLEEARPPANRGQMDLRLYLARYGTFMTAYCDRPGNCRLLMRGGLAYWRWIAQARRHLTGVLGAPLPPGLRELAVSVVYGDKITDLPEEIEEEFRRAGLTHILVASGTQVSLLIALMALCFWRPGDNRTLRGLVGNVLSFVVSTLLISTYAAVAGFETSILRALAMGLLLLGGRTINREPDALSALALSGFVMVALNPAELLSPGFQLSFMATFGLIYASGVLFPRLHGLGRWTRMVLAALVSTGGAQLFVLPLLMSWFNQLSLTSLPSNLLAIPLSFLLLITGGAYSLGLASVPLLGPALGWAVLWLSAALRSVADIFASLPLSQINVPAPLWWWVGAWYTVTLLAGEYLKHGLPEAQATRGLVRWASAVSLLILGLAPAKWLILPRAEVSVLALAPGLSGVREAYLWRDGRGHSLLFVRGDGLERQHNGDKVADSLAWRGVNRISGVVWIDGHPPEQGVCRLPPSTEITVGAALPGGAALGWIDCDGEVCGVEAGLRGRRIWMVWEPPVLEAAGEMELGRCDCLVVASRTWQRLPFARRRFIRASVGRVLIQAGEAEWAQHAIEWQGETIVASEAQLHATGNGIEILEFKPSG